MDVYVSFGWTRSTVGVDRPSNDFKEVRAEVAASFRRASTAQRTLMATAPSLGPAFETATTPSIASVLQTRSDVMQE